MTSLRKAESVIIHDGFTIKKGFLVEESHGEIKAISSGWVNGDYVAVYRKSPSGWRFRWERNPAMSEVIKASDRRALLARCLRYVRKHESEIYFSDSMVWLLTGKYFPVKGLPGIYVSSDGEYEALTKEEVAE